MENSSSGGSDRSFGPQYGSDFDFTLLFEQTILTIVPVAVLIVALPLCFWQLCHSPIYVRLSLLLWVKLGFAVCLVGLDCATLAVWTFSHAAVPSSITITASVLSCVASICIAAVIYSSHRHALRSSSIVTVYLTISILLDAAKAHTFFARTYTNLDVLGSLTVATASLKFILMILEEVPKRALMIEPKLRENVHSETVGGFWGRYLFIWVNRILLRGFHNNIAVDDLECLGPEFKSSELYSRFRTKWIRANKSSSHCLLITSAQAICQPLLFVIIPRLCFTALTFTQPLFLRRVVAFVGEEDGSMDTARGLVGACVLIYSGLTITKAVYTHMNYRMMLLLRGLLVSEIIRKSLAIVQTAAMESAAVTLMSTDIEGIVTGFPDFQEIWVSIIEVGIGLYLLTTINGYISFIVVAPVCIATAIATVIGKRIGPIRTKWNAKIEYRVAKTSEALARLKSLKMLALDNVVGKYIQSLRLDEIASFKTFRVFTVINTATAVFAGSITPIIVLSGAIFWKHSHTKIKAADIYTTLMIVSLIAEPLINVLGAAPNIASTIACFKRIQTYLLQTEVHDAMDQAEILTDVQSTETRQEKQQIQSTEVQSSGSANQTEPLIQFSNVKISGPDAAHELLGGVSFSLWPGETTVVLGPTASGKSTLLRAILGYADDYSGQIQYSKSNIAYCGQTPWLRNTTIRDNIVAENMFDPVLYGAVLHRCALTQDLERLSVRDQTIVGSDGIKLSNGQRHRVALARALYSRAPILVLDDIFSALDNETAGFIFKQLFDPSGGVLKEPNTAIILATHSLEYAHFANQALLLDGQGNVEVKRDLRSLHNTRSYPTQLARHETNQDKQETTTDSPGQSVESEESPEEIFVRRSGDFSLYFFYFKSIRLWLGLVWAISVIAVATTERLPEVFIRIWLETDASNHIWFVGYGVLGAVSVIITAIMMSIFYMKVVPDSAEYLHQLLLNSVIGSTLLFLTSTEMGSILNRFSQDMSLISQDLPGAFLQFIYNITFLVIDTAIITAGADYTATIIPLMAFALYFIQHAYLRTSRQMRFLDLEAKTPLYTQLTEMAKGLDHIRAFGWQYKYFAHSLALLDCSQKPVYYMYAIQRWLTLVLDLVTLCLVVTLVSLAVFLKHTTSEAGLGLSLLVVTLYTGTLTTVVEKWTALETSLGAIARVKGFTQHTPQEDTTGSMDFPAGWPQRGSIEFRGVTARYSPTSSPVLSDINLSIEGGQKVSLIGRTGSGKSSLLLTLLNMLVYTGSIMIDGVEISTIPRHHLRGRLITTISQDAVELEGTVRFNLLPFEAQQGSLYDASLHHYLAKIGLASLIQLRGGIDEPLSSMGLSKGQMQLLCIVRAILHNIHTGSKIVIMDEATSNLDYTTDAKVQHVMNEAFSGCTVLVVAHRLDTVVDADEHFGFADGRIVGTVLERR